MIYTTSGTMKIRVVCDKGTPFPEPEQVHAMLSHIVESTKAEDIEFHTCDGNSCYSWVWYDLAFYTPWREQCSRSSHE